MVFHAHRYLQRFGQRFPKDVIGIVTHERASVNMQPAVAFDYHPLKEHMKDSLVSSEWKSAMHCRVIWGTATSARGG